MRPYREPPPEKLARAAARYVEAEEEWEYRLARGWLQRLARTYREACCRRRQSPQ